jgi:hypothetical protein
LPDDPSNVVKLTAEFDYDPDNLPMDTIYDLDPMFAQIRKQEPLLIKLLKVLALDYVRHITSGMSLAMWKAVVESTALPGESLKEGVLLTPTKAVYAFEYLKRHSVIAVGQLADGTLFVKPTGKAYPFPVNKEAERRLDRLIKRDWKKLRKRRQRSPTEQDTVEGKNPDGAA